MDRYVRKFENKLESQVVGLRYFNVYGPNECHKDKMASLVRQMFYKNQETGEITLFEGTDVTKLLSVGYNIGFTKMEDAVAEYCELLENNEGYIRR